MDRIDIHEDLCAELHKLYVAKNADYGNSFAKVREEIPNAILVRLSDKLNRLKSLMTKDDDDRKVRDESIDDTLMDIANYALLELVERRYEGDYYEDEEEDFETYLRKVPFSEKMRRIKEILADVSENEEDEEEDEDDERMSFADAIDSVRNAFHGLGLNIKRNGLLNDWNHVELFIKKDDETGVVTIDKFIIKDQEVVSHHKSDFGSEGISLKFNDLFEYKDKTKTRVIFDKVERDLSGRTVDIRTIVTSEYRPAYKDFHVNTRVYYD